MYDHHPIDANGYLAHEGVAAHCHCALPWSPFVADGRWRSSSTYANTGQQEAGDRVLFSRASGAVGQRAGSRSSPLTAGEGGG